MNTHPYYISNFVSIQNRKVRTATQETAFEVDTDLNTFAKSVYKHLGLSYPKFYKMDNQSKLATLAASILLDESKYGQDIALLFGNQSASLDTDLQYLDSIVDPENYYPSPATFVYTLANICAGEVSIQHGLKSENMFFVQEEFNPTFFFQYSNILLNTQKADQVLCAWVEVLKDNIDIFAFLVTKAPSQILFTEENIIKNYKN